MTSPQGNDVTAADLHLKRLHKGCEITLERYGAVAGDTCKLLGRLRSLPVSKDKKLEIFLQKRKEDEARDAYLKARTALLAAIDSGLEYLEPFGAEVAEKVGPRRAARAGTYRRRTV